MENLKWEVTENNGGGLTLNVFDDGYGNEYLHSGYEYFNNQLKQDIAALYDDNTADTSKWDGNDLRNEEICRTIRTKEEDNQTVLPDDDEMYDSEGILIPLDIDDLYDDDDATMIIAKGDSEKIIYYPDLMGNAGKKELL